MMSQAAPTPVADDKGVYVFFELGDLFGFEHNGKLRWQRQLAKEYGAFRHPHGLSSSLVATKSDLGTRDLMIGYYRALERGEGRGEGLRKVQLEMLKRKDRRHPFTGRASSSRASGRILKVNGK